MNKTKNTVNLICLGVAICATFSVNSQTYFPKRGSWESQMPAQLGFNAERLNDAINFAKENEYSGSTDLRIATYESFSREPFHELLGETKKRGNPAGLIIKNGYVIAEWGEVNRVDMTFSVTKSFLSAVAGIAHDAKLIDVNKPVANYVWQGQFEGTHNSKITWDHLLTQSSDWYGDLFGLSDWSDRPPKEGEPDDWKRRTLNEPGTVYKYNDVRVNLLAYSLLQVFRKPLPQVLKENMMDKIGASTTWRWMGYHNSFVTVDGIQMQSVSGGGHNGGGMFINSTDMARFGYLFLRNGIWNGEKILSEEWIRMSQKPSSANPSYGYLWWLNNDAGSKPLWNKAPADIYYAAGFGGNFIVIDKKNDLVIVARWLEPNKLEEFVNLILAAKK
uniref:serine hydrolase domain-containing protein n=1 Tax=Fulvivirga sp. TaxID=1931237 RepID=UPI00404A423C